MLDALLGKVSDSILTARRAPGSFLRLRHLAVFIHPNTIGGTNGEYQ
jgi:hypothetical protein